MLNRSACHVAVSRDAVREVMGEWRRSFPKMGVLALLAEHDQDGVALLQEVAVDLEIPLVGAIFPALIKEGTFVSEGVWLLRLDEMVPTFLAFDLALRGEVAVADLVFEIQGALANGVGGEATPTLFMMFDAMVPNIGPVLDELYLQLADSVSYAGVNAGSEQFQAMPCLFDQTHFVQDGMLALLLPADVRPVLQHDYPFPDYALCATSAEGNCVKSIDWRPAFEVYQELVGRECGVDLSPANFYEHACHFPLGILRANQEVLVRIPVALRDDGAVVCVGDVPANAMLTLLKAPGHDLGSIQKLVDGLVQGNGDLAGRPLLGFYCAGRRMHMGASAPEELAALSTLSGCSALAGALSLGEIGSAHTWDYPLFHNAALVCLPWGRNQ